MRRIQQSSRAESAGVSEPLAGAHKGKATMRGTTGCWPRRAVTSKTNTGVTRPLPGPLRADQPW